jgi:hypothetical protein
MSNFSIINNKLQSNPVFRCWRHWNIVTQYFFSIKLQPTHYKSQSLHTVKILNCQKFMIWLGSKFVNKPCRLPTVVPNPNQMLCIWHVGNNLSTNKLSTPNNCNLFASIVIFCYSNQAINCVTLLQCCWQQTNGFDPKWAGSPVILL